MGNLLRNKTREVYGSLKSELFFCPQRQLFSSFFYKKTFPYLPKNRKNTHYEYNKS